MIEEWGGRVGGLHIVCETLQCILMLTCCAQHNAIKSLAAKIMVT